MVASGILASDAGTWEAPVDPVVEIVPYSPLSAHMPKGKLKGPTLSIPPVQRRARNATSLRSSPRAEHQRREKTTPSITAAKSFGFVIMPLHSQPGRMAASGALEGMQG